MMVGTVIRDYRLEEVIGAGGFGVVYRATQQLMNQEVAIKTLNAPLVHDPKFRSRFLDEARILARLRHQNIVAIYNCFELDGAYFIVMELMAGMLGPSGKKVRTLTELVKTGPIPEGTVRSIFAQVLAGLSHAHSQGVLHRDIKPANILFTEDGMAKLADFGIAKMTSGESNFTLSGTRVGTAPYMSPEQVLNKNLDGRSDIYALGVTLYEAVIGRAPFAQTEAASVEEQHLYEPPPRPRSINPNLSEGLESAVLRALEKKPEKRFRDCAEFLTAVSGGRILGPLPESATGRTASETRVEPDLRRSRSAKRLVAMIASVGGLVVLAVLVAFLKTRTGSARTTALVFSAPHAAVSVDRAIKDGRMLFIRRNDQGFDEYLWKRDSSVLVRIPAVEFVMGSEKTETSFYNKQAISTTCGDNERPAHVVQLGEYLIDKHEVTNGQYRMFCDATHTKYPQDPYFPDMLNYFRDYPDYPVMSVSWEDAAAYCRWADKRLPTEAEWEQAARGMDRRPYPWGRENPLYTPKQRFDGYLDSSHQYSAPVGSYPNGASPYGILDMAGNVQEWCNDWYGEGYYAVSPEMNPQGPASGTMRVIRGGSKQLFVFERCAARMFFTPKTYKYGDKYYYYPFTGFRCAIGCK